MSHPRPHPTPDPPTPTPRHGSVCSSTGSPQPCARPPTPTTAAPMTRQRPRSSPSRCSLTRGVCSDRAIPRIPAPWARSSAISSRSAKNKYRPEDGPSSISGIPPRSRNHREPTAPATPTSTAATSLLSPARPAPRTPAPRPDAPTAAPATAAPAAPSARPSTQHHDPPHTSTLEVLRRPVESTNYNPHSTRVDVGGPVLARVLHAGPVGRWSQPVAWTSPCVVASGLRRPGVRRGLERAGGSGDVRRAGASGARVVQQCRHARDAIGVGGWWARRRRSGSGSERHHHPEARRQGARWARPRRARPP